MEQKQEHEETIKGSSKWNSNENDHEQIPPSRHLPSIPDRVAGQESQFAEFAQKCLLRLSTSEREYLRNASDIIM